MKLREINDSDKILNQILETASTSATSSANIASVPINTGLMLKRMPTEPNLFGYIEPTRNKPRKKRKKRSN